MKIYAYNNNNNKAFKVAYEDICIKNIYIYMITFDLTQLSCKMPITALSYDNLT